MVGFATLACMLGNAVAACRPASRAGRRAGRSTGPAAAGIIPLTMAWIGDSVAYEGRQEVLARLLGATVFGMICGQWLGGLLADGLGWRWAFVLLASVFASSGALLTWRAGRMAVPSALQPAARPCRATRGPGSCRCWPAVGAHGAGHRLHRRRLRLQCAGFHSLAPASAFGLTMPMAGGIVALYGVGGLVYSRSAVRLLGRWGEPGLVRIGGACLGIGLLCVAVAPSWPWALPSCLARPTEPRRIRT